MFQFSYDFPAIFTAILLFYQKSQPNTQQRSGQIALTFQRMTAMSLFRENMT